MQNQAKETYKDYLVRKVTEEIGKVFEDKMDQAKKELKEIQYEDALSKTEEILKNYKKLSEHIVLTDTEKETLKDEGLKVDSKQKKEALWSYMKKENQTMWRHLRFSAQGIALNLPGKVGRAIVCRGYGLAQRFFGFS